MKTLLTLIVILLLFSTANVYSQVDSTTLNSSSITSNITLSRSITYLMKGFNYVQSGATITIEAGTKIFGDFNTTGTLIIQRGGKIYANGQVNDPILFTSNKPAGQRKAGDWGGIIILGRSGINTSTGVDSAEIEGFGAGLGPIYGGQPRIDNDSSGLLRYVRIEFPGVNLTGVSGNEINGLTMGGVGSKTVIDYVQVSYSGDDSFEWFGGTVNCKHLISYKALDDDWDCDNGFRGKVQFGLSVRDSSYADVSSSNGFEIDNNNNSPSNFNSPRTQPIFSNMTVIGPYVTTSAVVNPLFQRGGHLRRNNLASIYNSIIMSWRVGLRFDGSGVGNAAQADSIQIRNNIMAGNVKLADSTGTGSFSPQTWLQTSSFENSVYSDNSSVMLNSPFNIYPDAPLPGNNVNNWMPDNGSPALSGSSFNNPNLNGFENVTFRGAFGSVNWSLEWAQFNPREYNIIGISQISSVIPERFTLDQNYPNPFNPSTTINFSLPNSGLVSLKVYDISGKEIANLVNENLTVGTYEYKFNAASLSSGIYFYTLKSDNITETKKMLLVK
ncbi:MAG TPA: T9SS type A sorting domain-containing protein [Ignavibacteria bacterium]|nr:T9SS type A sorting domain-containing protein [Ignavibacteria bacterium]HRB00271.1 T9SS type A sorting domain-containing protein [Ignavibacteria bacterium]